MPSPALSASTTWVLSNHDVVRHATRYGLPEPTEPLEKHGHAWLLTGGVSPVLDRDRGLRRARAATLFELALPGSAYLYQGEELGLHEVPDIPADKRQDPAFFRNPGVEIGRDGCRVPLPWTMNRPSFGFGTAPAHLPQPDWFGSMAVSVQEHDPSSTLALYRRALELRRRLQTEETLEWLDAPQDVVRFRRPNGWETVMNFGTTPTELPAGTVLLASSPLPGRQVPAETTVWLQPASSLPLS